MTAHRPRTPEKGSAVPEKLRHGDRLPDTDYAVDRIFVSYPQSETAEAKAARLKAGLPAPRLEFVVATIKGGQHG